MRLDSDLELAGPAPPSLRRRLDADAAEALREGGPRPGAVRVEYKLTEDEAAAAARTVWLVRNRGSFAVLAGSGALCLLAASLLGRAALAQFGGSLLLLPLLLWWAVGRGARDTHRREPAFCDEFTIECDEDGVFSRSSRGYSVADWSLFQEVWEHGGLFMLLVQRFLYVTVPKRAFDSLEAVDRFRELARSHSRYRRV